MKQQSSAFEALLEIARDLTASLAGSDRYARLLEAVIRVIPCDAACLLRLQGDDLVPVARDLLIEHMGDGVLVSDFTFVATVNPITYQGARPVLVDADEETWNISATLVVEELARRENWTIERRIFLAGHREAGRFQQPIGIPLLLQDAQEGVPTWQRVAQLKLLDPLP
jgi:GAF domain-containing protein